MKISIQGRPFVCDAREGESILLACARAGLIFSAPCGGRRRCGKCKVRVLEGQVTGDSNDENGFVLACSAVPLSDLVIADPGSCLLTGVEPDSQTAVSNFHKQVGGGRLSRAGVAMDLGTTTIAVRLVDLDSSAPLDTVSELNDQRVFGADVMSRIGAAREGKTPELHKLINRQTERILACFKERWGLSKIEKLVVSGNTTMLHLFLNVDPSGLGEAPFKPVFLAEREISGESLFLSAETVTLLPSISAFVGGDITSGLASLDILNGPEPALFVDIGTNGEMALFDKGKLLCCSTAAGPAFEGAEISCGLGGVSGAISAISQINGRLSLNTIGNVPPRGLCGSGLIDAVALMLEQGIIDESGYMENSPYVLSPGVSIIDRDIRQFQLAKSAILSGIRILCKNAGLRPAEIKTIYVAGGFGLFINKKNAVTAGLFPKEFLDKITVSGNLSLQGAEDFLTVKDFLGKCRQIIERCSVIDLSLDPDFMDEFTENMLFGRSTGIV